MTAQVKVMLLITKKTLNLPDSGTKIHIIGRETRFGNEQTSQPTRIRMVNSLGLLRLLS